MPKMAWVEGGMRQIDLNGSSPPVKQFEHGTLDVVEIRIAMVGDALQHVAETGPADILLAGHFHLHAHGLQRRDDRLIRRYLDDPAGLRLLTSNPSPPVSTVAPRYSLRSWASGKPRLPAAVITQSMKPVGSQT